MSMMVSWDGFTEGPKGPDDWSWPFLDGHMDFYDKETNINGQVASSDLALVTGRGPALLTMYDGRCPLVRTKRRRVRIPR